MKWMGGKIGRIVVLAGLMSAAGCETMSPFGRASRRELKPVVAVSSFENLSGWKGHWKLGCGMADVLVSELLKSRHFVVVDRQEIDRVLNEIVRQRSRFFRPEGRVDVGRLKNARYLIRGTITDFSQTGGGGLGMAIRSFLFFGRGYTAIVSMTLTVIDVQTGEILNTITCDAKVRTHEAYVAARYKDISFGGSAFYRTPLGEATAIAIHKGVKQIIRTIPRETWKPMIADIVNGRIVVNGGTRRKIRPGQIYRVRGPGKPITDPATGNLLTMVRGNILGTVRITEARRDLAFAAAVRGGPFKRGQLLERVESPK